MRSQLLPALALATLGLSLASTPRVARSEESHFSFKDAKARAAESGKLVLVDFSSPT